MQMLRDESNGYVMYERMLALLLLLLAIEDFTNLFQVLVFVCMFKFPFK
jgi:hypothetical protein